MFPPSVNLNKDCTATWNLFVNYNNNICNITSLGHDDQLLFGVCSKYTELYNFSLYYCRCCETDKIFTANSFTNNIKVCGIE